REKGFRTVNVDATIIAQRPKLAPYIPQMRENIAARLGIDSGLVNIKATTEEGLGFSGSGEGMAAHSVALLEKSTE
ncbi:MAG: 2-C-methyl-D-erythritol 2,4-cyclodiphosphate synthase, partial [Candidatus Onthomonas sp.]|nr:2-C-methyl-D-erythritol 2,4-cyclodiphosphate synthase [Candidatus Onthomonas sp.]